MANILHLDSSPRGERSKSRQLAKDFLTQWQLLHPEDVITYRDLRKLPIPHVTEEWVAAAYTPQAERTSDMVHALAFSDELIDEFLAANNCVFSVPMYNFSVPSNFKAYIDHIVRIERTFTFIDGKFKGLVSGKKVLFITARGDEYSAGSPHDGWDAQEPALRFAFQFMGIMDICFIHASGLDLGTDVRKQGLNRAKADIQTLVTHW